MTFLLLCILRHSQVELGFMQQLGKLGNRDTVLALLRQTTLMDDMADSLWAGIQQLTKDMEEELERQKQEAAVQAELEAQAAAAQAELLEAMDSDAQSGAPAPALSGEELLADMRDRVAQAEREDAAEEEKRQAARAAREAERKEANEKGDVETKRLQVALDRNEAVANDTRQALDEAVSLQHVEAIASLQKKLEALEAEAIEAREEFKRHVERENQRREEELTKEAEIARLEAEERARIAAAKPKRWGLARADLKKRIEARSKSPKRKLKVNAKEYNESLKVGSGAFTLAYAPPSMYFQGLTAIVGRCDAEAGEDEKLLALMSREHCDSIDSDMQFEPPNFLIPTTSRIEYWAVADPKNGLRELGLDDWPKEQRLGPGHARKLWEPEHFQQPWDDMNKRLEVMAEPPLLLNGFVGLRMYTGPLFYKYNNVLRGVSVNGVKGPLEWLWMKLCHGNRYTNTLHVITAAINKCARVTKASCVYRAPGGILPKSFWDKDEAGVKGGIELGLMSTSRSKHAAMEYAKRSPVKLLFEIQQGMCARGADVSWLSMYPAEDEVLFAPCCACEVHNTRVEGSVVIVELRPAVAAAALQEKSIQQKEEERKIREERDAIEASQRTQAIKQAAMHRSKWMGSMSNLQVSASEKKRADAELAAAQAATVAAQATEREQLLTIENEKLTQSIMALEEMKKRQEEEAQAAIDAAESALLAKSKLANARKLGDLIKRAAMKERIERDAWLKIQALEKVAGSVDSASVAPTILGVELENTENMLHKEAKAKEKAQAEQKRVTDELAVKFKEAHTRTLAAEEKVNKLTVQLNDNKKMLAKLME